MSRRVQIVAGVEGKLAEVWLRLVWPAVLGIEAHDSTKGRSLAVSGLGPRLSGLGYVGVVVLGLGSHDGGIGWQLDVCGSAPLLSGLGYVGVGAFGLDSHDGGIGR